MTEENPLFILAECVAFIPATDVNEKTRRGFSYQEGDVIITYTNSRQSSKVISREFSLLLKIFETPQSFASAILNYSIAVSKDPQQVADEVFDPLLNLQQAGFLVPYTNGSSTLQKDKLVTAMLFRGYTVLKKIQRFEDTEVYSVKDDAEKIYALKLLTAASNSHVMAMFNNEVEVLRHLDGTINPGLKEYGTENDCPYLITEWCDGETCTAAAAPFKNTNSRDNTVKLIDFAIAIVKAFYHLHSQGILHGDIQPPNILISKKGTVKIIDYGYAAFAGNKKTIQRGGTGFYYEPEYAASVINNSTRPLLTEQGEQYSVAVLLYQIITGQHYLEFNYEKDAIYKQIVNDAPIPLKNWDLNFTGKLDAVFAKALSKNPGERFSSLNELALALQEVRNKVFDSRGFFIQSHQNNEQHFTHFLINKFGWHSSFIETGLMKPPQSSVNYGAAGIAYFFYRMACIRQDTNLISLADHWANRATSYENNFEKSFYSASLGITEKSVGNNSLYHSPAGLHLTQALISHAKGDYCTLAESIRKFIIAAEKKCSLPDLALGKCGLLLGCSLLYRELKSTPEYNVSVIEKLAAILMQEIWNEADGETHMHLPNKIGYFGIAHGWAGLLYATLHWCSNAASDLPKNFYIRVEELIACAVKKDNVIYWPLSVTDKKWWPGWCNGSAGYIFLLLLLYKHFNDNKFLDSAISLSNNMAASTQWNNSNLCCGTAGTAYAVTALYKTIGEKKLLQTINKLKQAIMKNINSPALDNNSLYKGEVGPGVFICESENLNFARMPLFE